MNFISSIIRSRRAYFHKMYSELPVSEDIIHEILENANWAPTHKRTEPWRFKVFHSIESRQKLVEFIAADYKSNTSPELFSEIKMKDQSEKPLVAACTIAICMQRDPALSLPEWEEIASVACAVQNMWLTCTAYQLGSYWATPGFISRLGPFLELEEGQRCIGLFYIGQLKEGVIAPAVRTSIDLKVKFMN
jgi:nitroreductase